MQREEFAQHLFPLRFDGDDRELMGKFAPRSKWMSEEERIIKDAAEKSGVSYLSNAEDWDNSLADLSVKDPKKFWKFQDEYKSSVEKFKEKSRKLFNEEKYERRSGWTERPVNWIKKNWKDWAKIGVGIGATAAVGLAGSAKKVSGDDGGFDPDNVTLIVYHQIDDGFVSKSDLDQQMKWLKDSGYSFMTVNQIGKAMRDGVAVSKKTVGVTFDDIWESQFENAKPILDRYGVKASFAAIVKELVRTNHDTDYMTRSQVKKLSDDGHDIMLHSFSHPEGPDQDLAKETIYAQKKLSNILGKRVESWAYPNCIKNDDIDLYLIKAGIKNTVQCEEGDWSSTFSIPRKHVNPGMPLSQFVQLFDDDGIDYVAGRYEVEKANVVSGNHGTNYRDQDSQGSLDMQTPGKIKMSLVIPESGYYKITPRTKNGDWKNPTVSIDRQDYFVNGSKINVGNPYGFVDEPTSQWITWSYQDSGKIYFSKGVKDFSIETNKDWATLDSVDVKKVE